MAPPPAMTPTGEATRVAADVMAAAIPSSVLVAVVGRKAQCAVFPVVDEGEDLRERGILRGQGLHRVHPLAKVAGAENQFLIERPHLGQPFLGETAALHA